MHIEKFKNNGVEYLRLSKSHYNSELKKQRKTVVKNLGPLSRFDDGKPDFLKRLRESFRNGNPILDELLPFTNGTMTKENAQVITLQAARNVWVIPSYFHLFCLIMFLKH